MAPTGSPTTGLHDPAVLSIVSGPSLRVGQTSQFTATLNGIATSQVSWSLPVVLNPTPDPGSVSANGLYSTPTHLDSPINVTVKATLTADASVYVTNTFKVMPPVPAIKAVLPNPVVPGAVTFEVDAESLLPDTKAFLNGSPMSMTYESASKATVSGMLTSSAASAALVLQNPWDDTQSAAFQISVESPSFPAAYSELVGCENPNTAGLTTDWGPNVVPVYFPLDGHTLLNLYPTYNSNTIFWVSRETKPGQSVLLTGAFTSSTKTARLAVISAATGDWESVVRKSSSVVSTIQQGSTGLSFQIPSEFADGIYGFEIEDASAAPVFGLANVPQMNWAVGLPPVTDRDGSSATPSSRLRCRTRRRASHFREEFPSGEPHHSSSLVRRRVLIFAVKN